MRNSAITNEALTANLNGCQSGQGIFVESGGTGSSSIMIVNNTVSGFQKNGIAGHDANTILTVQLNTVTGQGPTTGAAENGIELAYGATGRVINNYVADMIYSPVAGNTSNGASGILLYAAPGSTVLQQRRRQHAVRHCRRWRQQRGRRFRHPERQPRPGHPRL